jgi:Transcriptional regulators
LTECAAHGTNRLALRRTIAQPAVAEPRRGPISAPPRIDELDQGIIEELQANGRESFRAIASRLGVSEATVRARYARLCGEDILQVVGVTNPLGLGFEQALIGVKTAGSPEPVADEIASWIEADYVVVTAGSTTSSSKSSPPTVASCSSSRTGCERWRESSRPRPSSTFRW